MNDTQVYFAGFTGSLLIHILLALNIYVHFASLWQFSETIVLDVDISLLRGTGEGEGAPAMESYSAPAPAPAVPEPVPVEEPEVSTAPEPVKKVKPKEVPKKAAPVSTPLAAPPVQAETAPGGGGTGIGVVGGGGGPVGSGGSGGAGGAGAKAVYTPRPIYPWAARNAGFEGSVLLEVLVDSDGDVGEVIVARGSGRADCDESAVKAVSERWEFTPARVNGQTVASRQKIVIRYQLR